MWSEVLGKFVTGSLTRFHTWMKNPRCSNVISDMIIMKYVLVFKHQSSTLCLKAFSSYLLYHTDGYDIDGVWGCDGEQGRGVNYGAVCVGHTLQWNTLQETTILLWSQTFLLYRGIIIECPKSKCVLITPFKKSLYKVKLHA